MGFFKKLGKLGKKALKTVARPALSIATAGLSEKAIGIGKSIGHLVKSARGDQASRTLTKMPQPQLAALITKSRIGTPGIAAQTMPGGAPLPGSRPRRRKSGRRAARALPAGFAASVRQAKKLRAASKTAIKAKSNGGGKLKDLKALSASWKGVGKPGRWMQWVKSH